MKFKSNRLIPVPVKDQKAGFKEILSTVCNRSEIGDYNQKMQEILGATLFTS